MNLLVYYFLNTVTWMDTSLEGLLQITNDNNTQQKRDKRVYTS